MPAERGGGPGKPTYIELEDLQAWCAGEGVAVPIASLERSERLTSDDLMVFFQQFRPIIEAIERLERRVEETLERLERSQAHAIEQGITQALTQLRAAGFPGVLEKFWALSQFLNDGMKGSVSKVEMD